MIFKQNKEDGSCEIIFSENEIKIINEKKKFYLDAESLRHFGNVLMKMVADWNINFNDELNDLIDSYDNLNDAIDDIKNISSLNDYKIMTE